MALSASSIDPDISAAFSGQSSQDSSAPAVDSDIAEAFKSDATGKPKPAAAGEISALQMFEDMGKGIAGTVAHSAGNLADVVTGTSPGAGSHAERWSAPFAITDALGQLDPDQQKLAQAIGKGYDKVAGTGPLAQTVKERVPQALEAIGAVTPIGEAAAGLLGKSASMPLTAEQIVAKQAMNSPQSMGAAAAAPNIANLSPELKQAIVSAAQKTGGAVSPEALARHVEADSLPVKMQLTEGQATQDPTLLSNEVNSRAKDPAFAQRYNDQNSQLGQNIQAIRDKVGPDVFSTNQVEHGDTLIQAYKDKDAAVQADINSKYQALRDANGATMPIDTGKLVSNVDAQLKKQYLTDSVPPQAQSILSSLRAGEPMDFEGFEAARSRLAEAQRAGGSEAKAAGIIRNNLEQMPLQPQAAGLKDLADTARSAAKARFDALDADPAYNAAVNETVSPDRFASKFVINGDRDNVTLMKQNLAGNDTAQQTIGVSALDHLRDQARIGPGQSGNFAADSFNRSLTALGPKGIFDPQTAETLSSVGNVAKNVKGQPAGSYVNNSNTFTALAGEHAKGALEGAANVAAHGVPVGTWIRKAAQARSQAAQTQQALAPGAGLTRLSDIGKP